MPKTKAKTTTATPALKDVADQQRQQHIDRLRDAVAVLAEEEVEARRQADTCARQQLSASVIRAAQTRAVEKRQRLREACEALFLAETRTPNTEGG